MNNKGSDKNVSSIEDDVKILEEFAEICKAGLACYDQTREGEALEHLLAEREQDKARIQELEEQVKTLDEAYTGTIKESKKWYDIAHNSIPKQVVKDKMKEVKRLRDRCITAEAYNIAQGEIIVLQELLEGGK